MRCRKFVRDLSRATLQLCLARLRPFLFPFPNISLELFETRRAHIDLIEHHAALRLFFRPFSRCISRDRFDSPNSRSDRFLAHNPKWPDLRCRSYMRATAKFHRVAIQLPRLTADL